MKFEVVILIAFLILDSCDYCKAVYGEESLGSRFMLVNENDDQVYILYCTSQHCCTSGVNIVPSKVEQVKFDDTWIIAESKPQDGEATYWIINKDFEVDLTKYDDESSHDVIMSNVAGPLDQSQFLERRDSLNIELSFE